MALPLLVALFLLRSVWALWPIPAALGTGTTPLILSSGFYFDVAIQGAPWDLYQAVEQAQYYLQNDKLGRLVVGRGANDSAALTDAYTLTSLQLTLASDVSVDSIASESVKPLGTRSEGYVLTIPADGQGATLTANSTLGLYRGLTTFGQLWYYYGDKTYTLEAPIAITDAPAYVRAAFLACIDFVVYADSMTRRSPIVDSCSIQLATCAYRVFFLVQRRVTSSASYSFPVPDLLRTLDAMSWVKINTFHWHITDSQSFPLEVAQYPELAANGAYSTDQTYSEDDVQYVVQYAASVRLFLFPFDPLLILCSTASMSSWCVCGITIAIVLLAADIVLRKSTPQDTPPSLARPTLTT